MGADVMSSFDVLRRAAGRTWICSAALRWSTPPGTTAAPPVLEQLWRCEATGEVEWRPVPLVARDA